MRITGSESKHSNYSTYYYITIILLPVNFHLLPAFLNFLINSQITIQHDHYGNEELYDEWNYANTLSQGLRWPQGEHTTVNSIRRVLNIKEISNINILGPFGNAMICALIECHNFIYIFLRYIIWDRNRKLHFVG